jgi:class 3 adenylate cyclase
MLKFKVRKLGLTAILAADVAGYSRLMAADEEGTHERLRAHLAQLVDPKIRAHKGRTVKTTGDGLLAEFASVVDAVRCAAEVQRGMIEPRRDVDTVAEDVVVLGDDVAEVDANAKSDAPLLGDHALCAAPRSRR